MFPRHFFVGSSVALLWSLFGCGPEVVASPSAQDDSGGTDGSGVEASSWEAESCTVVCNQREWMMQHGATGHCPFSSSVLPRATRNEYCEALARWWAVEELDVFGRCMLGDPLCYVTIDECMELEL